ncbi:MAG: helix-turn-helix transcriptional regulator [Phycisphaeraceae bacterium]|nr:helix-turn-helix transcriptional regulator [Phycisphaeraceae bacterium]
MDESDLNMDDICAWINRLSNWCDRSPIPAIPFAGFSGGGYYNPPAEHLELAYMIRGQVDDLQIGNRLENVPEKNLALHSVHFGNVSKRTQTGQRSICMFLDVTGIKEFACLKREPLFCCMPIKDGPRIISLFEKISTLCLLSGQHVTYTDPTPAYDPAQQSAPGRLRMKGGILELLAALIQEASPSTNNSQDIPTASIVGEAATFMARTYRLPHLCLSDVAKSASVHPDHLGRLFRKQMRQTPMQYLKRLRMNRATILLRQSDLSIGEIALEVGFIDPLHFSRVFRQQIGQCARDYRLQRNR